MAISCRVRIVRVSVCVFGKCSDFWLIFYFSPSCTLCASLCHPHSISKLLLFVVFLPSPGSPSFRDWLFHPHLVLLRRSIAHRLFCFVLRLFQSGKLRPPWFWMPIQNDIWKLSAVKLWPINLESISDSWSLEDQNKTHPGGSWHQKLSFRFHHDYGSLRLIGESLETSGRGESSLDKREESGRQEVLLRPSIGTSESYLITSTFLLFPFPV